MKEILQKTGLLNSFSIELDISVDDLMKEFHKIVDVETFDLLEIFKNDKKNYEGSIKPDSFEFKKRKVFLSLYSSISKAYGQIKKDNNKIKISGDIFIYNGFYSYFILISYTLITLFLSTLAIGVMTYSFIRGDFKDAFITIFAITIFLFSTIGLPLFFMRRSNQNLKDNLIHELVNIEKSIKQIKALQEQFH